MQNEMLEAVREFVGEIDANDILTELQHFGGNTNLIDFTTDYHIALSFSLRWSNLKREDESFPTRN